METKVSAHFLMGGARVNGRGETNIPGLFAGGEAAAGYHGGNRLGGNALSEILVSGSRAGKHAGIWAKENGKAQLKEKDLGPRLQAWHERVSRWRTRSSGLRPVDGKRRIQDLMWEKGGVIREGGKMKSALDSLKALREEADQTLAISPVRRVNRELLEAFELFHMVTVSDLVLRAAIAREESRGAHYREDFPFPDDSRWLVNLVLKKTGEGLSLRKERVKFIHLKPEGWEDGTEGDEQNKGAAV
jgi:succinate dehydrogenase / fumarate reductase flavoprotein subunit